MGEGDSSVETSRVVLIDCRVVPSHMSGNARLPTSRGRGKSLQAVNWQFTNYGASLVGADLWAVRSARTVHAIWTIWTLRGTQNIQNVRNIQNIRPAKIHNLKKNKRGVMY